MPGPLDALKEAYGRATRPQPGLESQLGEVTQGVMPMFPGSLLSGLRGALGGGAAKIAPELLYKGGTATAAGSLPQDLAAGGGEVAQQAYNAVRPQAAKALDPVEQAFQRILAKGGR